MKKVMFWATMVAAMLVCAPASAQSRKDKKEAAKAQWEMEQQQKQEEAALLHQMKMDSIRNAQKVREAEAAKAEAAARQAEMDAKIAQEKAEADARKAEQAAKKKKKKVVLPCATPDMKSNDLMLRAFSSYEGLDLEAAQQGAYISARRELAGMVEVAIQALSNAYLKGQGKDKKKEQERRLETLTMQSIDRVINFATPACEEYEQYEDEDGNDVYICYVVFELNRESVLKPLHNILSKEASDLIESDYDKFKGEFKEHFAKHEEQVLDKATTVEE